MTARPGDRAATAPGAVARLLLRLLRVYRLGISPLLAPRCRFVPSCSAYAVEAVTVHGAGRGSWLATRRLARCHPFHRGGHDPVPEPPPPAARPSAPPGTPVPPAVHTRPDPQ